jgi:hypothetical protein
MSNIQEKLDSLFKEHGIKSLGNAPGVKRLKRKIVELFEHQADPSIDNLKEAVPVRKPKK